MLMKINEILELTHDLIENTKVGALRRRPVWRSRSISKPSPGKGRRRDPLKQSKKQLKVESQRSELSCLSPSGRTVQNAKFKNATNEPVNLLKTLEGGWCMPSSY